VNGELIPSTQESTEDRVVQAQVSGSKAVLRIGDTDPIPLELTLTGDSESEGRIVADSSEVPPQKKPWHSSASPMLDRGERLSTGCVKNGGAHHFLLATSRS